jgi:hypothetical protein
VKAIIPPVMFHHEKGIPGIEYNFIVKIRRALKYAEKTGKFSGRNALFGGRGREERAGCRPCRP